MPFGRPTKFDPEFCERLIETMSSGASLAEFAADLRVTRSTIYQWAEDYPEFSDAIKLGRELQESWYNKVGRAAMAGKLPDFRPVIWIFTMKTQFGWIERDERKLEHTGPNGEPLQMGGGLNIIIEGESAKVEEERPALTVDGERVDDV